MSVRGDLAGRLLTVLEAEEKLYLELRSLLQEERAWLVALDAARIEEAVQRKESLAAEGRLLEEARIELARALARELGVDDERPTLSRLCARLGDDAEPLQRAHSRLVALVGASRELLDANAGFAGEALAQVRSTLQLLGRLLPAQPTYAPDLAAAEPTGARLVRRSA